MTKALHTLVNSEFNEVRVVVLMALLHDPKTDFPYSCIHSRLPRGTRCVLQRSELLFCAVWIVAKEFGREWSSNTADLEFTLWHCCLSSYLSSATLIFSFAEFENPVSMKVYKPNNMM